MLTYIAEWNRENEERTWSGTTYSLLKALENKVEVVRVDANYDLLTKVYAKIMKTAHQMPFLRHEKLDIRSKTVLWENRRRMNQLKLIVDPKQPALQIGDFAPFLHSIIYQDLSFSVLEDYKISDPGTFKYSGFQNMPDLFLKEKLTNQERNYDSAEGIACMSHWFAANLQATKGDKAFYAGAGINTPIDSELLSPRKRHQILFVGRDFKRKGGDLVVEAFRVIKREFNDATLILAGPVNLPKQVTDIEGVYAIGDVSSAQIGELMRNSAIMALPSRFEAFGLSFVEALANGLPIIGRDKFEMPFFVKQGSGSILQSSSDFSTEVRELSLQLKVLLTDNNYLNQANARKEFIRHYYSWDAVADRILNKFKQDI